MAHTPKPLRRRALREAPGIARRGLGVALTGRFLGAGAVAIYQQDCGHEVLQIPATVHYPQQPEEAQT